MFLTIILYLYSMSIFVGQISAIGDSIGHRIFVEFHMDIGRINEGMIIGDYTWLTRSE